MINMQNVRKVYPGFELNCSLRVPAGRITGLIGQNGAGKSTLFKIALGLVRPSSGTVEIFGKPVSAFSEQDMGRIGTVLTGAGFSEYLTVQELGRLLRQFYPSFDAAFFGDNCERFGLNEKKPIRNFSTGMKVKLKVLTALSHRADLLILDEPTAGLDVLVRDDILTLLRNYMHEDENRSILISSHISTDLAALCDDYYMIDKGKMVLHEDANRLLNDYAVLKLSDEQFARLDKQYLLKVRHEKYDIRCLTDQRAFYLENYPDIVVEKGGIDELMQMMIRGENV